MANSIFDGSNQYIGGISFSSPSFNLGSSGGVINGGYNFDLPLATVAAFNQQGLNFAANNSSNALGFLQGVMGQSQSHVTRVADRSFDFGQSALDQLQRMNTEQQSTTRYVAKKLSQGGGCFITTAICEADGKADDCEELQTLRKFRDEVLMASPIGANAVAEYYVIAPRIVEAIDKSKNAAASYEYLKRVFLLPAIDAVKSGNHVLAFSKYRRMVKVAAAIAGV